MATDRTLFCIDLTKGSKLDEFTTLQSKLRQKLNFEVKAFVIFHHFYLETPTISP